MTDLRPEPVRVVAYDPAWPQHFVRLRDRILPVIKAHIDRVEHVGSTSVPGLAAKPIIDMDVIVTSPEALEACIVAMEPLGYQHRGELGIAGRHAFTRPEGLPTHNLYVCLEGSLGLRNHLLLRDHLRAHPEAVEAYGALKMKLAQAHTYDRDAYLEGKTAWIVSVLQKYTMDAQALAEIVRVNKAPR